VDGSSFKDCFLNYGAERLNLRPGARGLKALGDDSVEEAEVSDVGDHVGQLITLDTIFGTSGQTLVLFRNFVHGGHLEVHKFLWSFK
jgi:hypothetical protein